MSEKRLLILLVVIHIIVFTLMGIGAMAENNKIINDERNSYVYILSKTPRTEALSLYAEEGNNISILFPHVEFHIIAKNNTTYSITLDGNLIAQGVTNASRTIIVRDFGETQGHLTIIVGSEVHDFGTVIIKKQLTAKDIGEEEGNYLKVTPWEWSWAQWKAALGTFIASLFSLPLAYVVVKFYLERRGEYAT